MMFRVAFPALLAAVAVFAQQDKPADTTRIFGAPSPSKTDKNLLRAVTGVVKDPDGNPVAGALVFLKDLKTGKERSIAAAPNGTYRFEDLYKANDYQLRAAKDRLASPTKTLSNFDTRLQPVMNLVLEPASAPAPSTAGKK